MEKRLIYQIAKRCREVSEKFVGSLDAHGFDFFSTSDNPDLSCFCACASWFLAHKLKEKGIPALVIMGNVGEDENNHCWVEVEGNIVDITATQFLFAKNKPVIVASYKEYEQYYGRGRIIESIEISRSWPDTQKPNKKVIKKLERLYYEKG